MSKITWKQVNAKMKELKVLQKEFKELNENWLYRKGAWAPVERKMDEISACTKELDNLFMLKAMRF